METNLILIPRDFHLDESLVFQYFDPIERHPKVQTIHGKWPGASYKSSVSEGIYATTLSHIEDEAGWVQLKQHHGSIMSLVFLC